jgi:hypothetical protein
LIFLGAIREGCSDFCDLWKKETKTLRGFSLAK